MTRGRLVAIMVTALVVLGVAVGYFVYVRSATEARIASADGPASADRAEMLAAPHVVFRNSALGTDYGRLAAVSLSDPAGPRAVFDISCERAFATADAGVCVTAKRGVVQTYGVSMLGSELQQVNATELVGLPEPGPDVCRRLAGRDDDLRHRALVRAGVVLHGDDHPPRRQEPRQPRDVGRRGRRPAAAVGGPQLLGCHLRFGRRHLLRHGRLRGNHLADEGFPGGQEADLAADRRRVPVAVTGWDQGGLQEAARQHARRESGGSRCWIWPPARRH